MPDKDRIIELLNSYGVGGSYAYNLCDEIEECYADELGAAEKWRTLVRISKCNQIACIEGTCQYKILCNPQMPLCGEARDMMLAIFDVNKVVQALEGEGEKG